jgi:hypothetical protein
MKAGMSFLLFESYAEFESLIGGVKIVDAGLAGPVFSRERHVQIRHRTDIC